MSHRYNLGAVDRTLRDNTHFNPPFRGKTVLLIGDIRQILPDGPSRSRSQIIGACFKRYRLYTLLKTIHLYENIQLITVQRDETGDQAFPQFTSSLLNVGEGKV